MIFQFPAIMLGFWVAFVASAILAAPIFKLLIAMKSRQTIYQYAPGTHQVKQGTPTMGGLILVAGFLVASLVIGLLQVPHPQLPTASQAVYGIGLPVLVLFLGFAAIGFIDDFVMPKIRKTKRGLAWKEKIVLQAVTAFLCCYWYYGQLDWRLGLGVFIILFASNAFNFADGLDGLACSILLGLCAGLVVLLDRNNGNLVVAIAALVGATVPFMYLNSPPAKLFMGDVGSLAIGSVLGLALTDLLAPAQQISYWTQPYPNGSFAQADATSAAVFLPSMILPVVLLSGMLLVELVPVPIQIASVKLFKRKVFPFTPVHHAFEKAGWPETRVVWTFAIAQLLFTMLALAVWSFQWPR